MVAERAATATPRSGEVACAGSFANDDRKGWSEGNDALYTTDEAKVAEATVR